jgi:hypothetical protein
MKKHIFFCICIIITVSAFAQDSTIYMNKGYHHTPSMKVYQKSELVLRSDSTFSLRYVNYLSKSQEVKVASSEEEYKGSYHIGKDTLMLSVFFPELYKGKEIKFGYRTKKIFYIGGVNSFGKKKRWWRKSK